MEAPGLPRIRFASGSLPPDDTEIVAHFTLDVGVTTQGACNAIEDATAAK